MTSKKNWSKEKAFLQKVYIAAPCDVKWDDMSGDERIRFCHACKLNVHNIADMTDKEAYTFLRRTDDRPCIKLFKRADGTIITDNCPRGLRFIRDRIRTVVAACLALLVMVGLAQAAQAQGLVGSPAEAGRLGLRHEVGGNFGMIPMNFAEKKSLLSGSSWVLAISAFFWAVRSPMWNERTTQQKMHRLLTCFSIALILGLTLYVFVEVFSICL